MQINRIQIMETETGEMAREIDDSFLIIKIYKTGCLKGNLFFFGEKVKERTYFFHFFSANNRS